MTSCTPWIKHTGHGRRPIYCPKRPPLQQCHRSSTYHVRRWSESRLPRDTSTGSNSVESLLLWWYSVVLRDGLQRIQTPNSRESDQTYDERTPPISNRMILLGSTRSTLIKYSTTLTAVVFTLASESGSLQSVKRATVVRVQPISRIIVANHIAGCLLWESRQKRFPIVSLTPSKVVQLTNIFRICMTVDKCVGRCIQRFQIYHWNDTSVRPVSSRVSSPGSRSYISW